MSLPYPITTVHGNQAVQTLNNLRQDAHSTPLILGGPEALERMSEAFDECDDSVEDLLAQAANIDPLAWLAEQEAEARADAEDADDDAEELEEDEEDDFAEWMDEAADGPPLDQLSAHLDVLSQKPLPQVSIAQLPTGEAWQAACFLKIGGWNAMPHAPVHSALWQMWQTQYGASGLRGRRRDRVHRRQSAHHSRGRTGAGTPANHLLPRHRRSGRGQRGRLGGQLAGRQGVVFLVGLMNLAVSV